MAARAQGAASRRPAPFAVGERLVFSLQYGPVKAGTGTLAVSGIGRVGSTPCYHFVSLARSVPFFDDIYPVRDLVESYADTASLVTVRAEKHLREGDYKLDAVARFDPSRGAVVYDDGVAIAIKAGARDPLAAFYYVRTMDLAVGRTITLPGHGDRRSYDLAVRVARRETVKTPLGRFRCLVLEPALQSTGVFRQTGRMTIWVTDDDRHLPVKLSSKVTVGSVVGILTSASGVMLGGGPPIAGASSAVADGR